MNYLQQFRQRYSEYDDLSDQEVLDGLYRNHYSDLERSDFDARMAAEVPVPDDEGEIDLGTAFGAGVDILQQGLYSAAEGVGETLDVDFIKEFGREGVERQKEDLAKATGLQQFREIGGVGDTVEFAGEQIAQQLPIMAPMLAGAGVGAKIGAGIGALGMNPITPAIGGFLGGVVGGALAGIPLFYGQNRERQKEVSGSVQSEGAAFATAIPQAALDSALGAITLGLGRVGGPALNQLLDAGGGVLTRGAKGFGFGSATEIPTEIGQQALERYQAGLELDSEDAVNEYIDAGAAALFVGGAFGTAGNVTFGNRQTLAEMRAEADDTALQQDLETLLAANNLKVDDLTDQEIVEFAEQEREKDPFFDYILSSGLADATKAKVLRRRMSEIFTGVLSEQQVGNPVDEGAEPLRIGQETLLQLEYQPGREETVVAREGDRPVTLLLNDEETLRVAEGYRTRFPEIDEILKSDFDNTLIKMRALRRALAELIPGQQAVGTGTAEIRAGDFSTELQEERGGIAPGAEGAPRLADRTGQPAERGALLQQEQADQAIAEDILARGEQEREDAQRRTTETLEAASATVSPSSELTDQQFETQQTLEAAGRVLRGEQASTLGPEEVATVEGERGNVPTFRAVQDARERVNGLLGRLEGLGSGGIEAARAVRERIEQRNLTGDQALGMLRAAEAFAETLPVDAKNVELRFLDKVMVGAAAAEASGGGATAQDVPGRRLSTGNGLDGIIEISLGQPSSVIRSTAAHEAFHVMQDVYADVDPGAANILNRAFGRPNETKKLKDLPSGVVRMLKKAEFAPGQSFWKQLTAMESAGGAPIQSGELQAYTYQAYNLLKNQGKKVPGLGGAMSRYMIFNKKFFERLANSLRGDGFRTATEVFAQVPQTAQRRADVQPTTGLREERATPRQPAVTTPREERVTPRQPAVTTPREEAAPVVTPAELADLETQIALIETPQTVSETQDPDAPGSMLSFANVLMGDITPAEFQQSQQAIGLQMSGTGQLSRDTGREFARADFWGVPLEDGGFQIFPGIAQRQNVAMHLSNDGDVGRQAYNGLYDIRQTPDNQFRVIAPSRAEVDQQGNISITEKGKVALPDWSMVSTPEESEFEQASMLDRFARRATGVEKVQDGNVTRRFGIRDVPDLIRQRMDAGLPSQEITSLLEDTDITSEQASALAVRGMRELEPRLEEFDGFQQDEYAMEINQTFPFELDVAGTDFSREVEHNFYMRLSRNPDKLWKDTYVAFQIDGEYSLEKPVNIEHDANLIKLAAAEGRFEQMAAALGDLVSRAAEQNLVNPLAGSPEFEALTSLSSDSPPVRIKKIDDVANLLKQQQRIKKKHDAKVASELFPLASAMVARHIKQDLPNILRFTSSSQSGSRSRIYHKAGQKIADEYGYEVRTFFEDADKTVAERRARTSSEFAYQYILSPGTAAQLDAFTNDLPELLNVPDSDKEAFSIPSVVEQFVRSVLPRVTEVKEQGIEGFVRGVADLVDDYIGYVPTDLSQPGVAQQVAQLFGLVPSNTEAVKAEAAQDVQPETTDSDAPAGAIPGSMLDRARRGQAELMRRLLSDDSTEQASTLALSMERLDQRIPQADRVASPNPRAPLTANSFTSILGGNGGGFNGTQADINRIFEESIAETDDDGGTTARDAVKAVKMRPPNAAFWNRAFKQPNRVRYWYEASAEAFRDLTNFRTPEALARFIDIVSGTSGGVEPYPNLMRAMGVASEDAQGIPIRTDLRDPASATKALAPSDMETLKFGNFAGTMQFINGLTPKAPLSTNDTQVASAFGFPGTALASKPILYEVLSRFYQKLRDVQNAGLAAGEQPYESWQVQALGWVEERGRKKETKQNVSDDYGEALPKIISTLQANGVPVPGGQITETTLQDPRVPNLMSGTRRYFDQGRFATVETASELTPEGKRAAEIYEYLRGREEIPWVRDAKKRYIRQQRIPMEELARRKRTGGKKTADPSLLSNIMSELVGTKVEVSRVDPRNFTGWGTFESVMSPNLRIPMQFRVMETQGFASLTPVARRALLAMLGKALGQKAMAASQFTPAADPANPDTFRVFVQTTDPANFNPTVIETFERDAGGFPLNIEEVPNGYTIDLNVGGFDVGPNRQTVEDAVAKNLGNQDATIYPMDYASDYIEENGYVDANGDFQTVNGYDSFINELLEQDNASQIRDDTRGVGRSNRLKTRSFRDNLTRYAAQLEEIAAARDDGFREWSDGVEGLLAKERRKEDERRAKQARIRTKDTLNAAKAARKQMRTTGEQASVLGFPSIPINTPEFKNWFKDSKIVDADGNPLVLYHGTERDFDTFDFQAKPSTLGGQSLRDALERMGVETEFFYLTNDPLIANSYADIDFGAETGIVTPGGNVMPVYASIQNPAILDGSGTDFIGIENALKVAIAFGNYDGVVIQNFNDHARSSVYGRPSTTVIAFKPTQIKSVFNQGTFDPKDARIQASALSINTPAFKNWFKRSKVVDSQGNPLVVYHGTTTDFDTFDATKGGGTTGAPDARKGFFFSSDPEIAASYAEMFDTYVNMLGDNRFSKMYADFNEALLSLIGAPSQRMHGAQVLPVYISIQNPFTLDMRGQVYNPRVFSDTIDAAKDAGHDGVIVKNVRDSGFELTEDQTSDIFIPFRPTQIKSVFNRGTFDPQDARIQASTLGRTDFRGGGRRAPDEIILTAAELYESGLSLRAVSKELADRGLVNPKTGRPYTVNGVHDLLRFVGSDTRGQTEANRARFSREIKFKKPFSLEGRMKRGSKINVDAYKEIRRLAEEGMGVRQISSELAKQPEKYSNAKGGLYGPAMVSRIINDELARDGDPSEQASALGYNPIFAAGAQPRPIQSLLSRVIPTSFKEFRRQMINGFDPIADLEMRVNSGKLRDATRSAFKMAELSLQLTGRTEAFLLNGPPVFDPNTGAVNADTSIGGLKDIFEPIGSGEKYLRFQDYAYARRAEELINDPNTKPEVKQNLEESFPAELRQQALALGNPEFDQVLARYKAFNDAMLQYLVDTGLISEAQRDGMARTSLYVPFYKLADEDAKEMNPDVLGPQLRSGLSNPDAGIKALTGEGGQIGDLYENVIRNAQTFLGAGLRNEAMRRSVDLMAEAEIGGVQREKGPTTVTYKVGGQDRHYNISKPNAAGQIDPDAPALFSALTSFSRPQTEGVFRVMETISNVFRAGITISPGFMVANFIRGDLAGAVTTDGKLRLLIDSTIGLKAALTNNQSVQDLKQLSGVGGYAFGGRSKGFANQLKRDFRKGEEVVGVTTKITDVLANLWNRAEAVGEATELATREAIFRRLKEAGFNDLEAAYQGQALINYGRRGNPDSFAASALGTLIPLVPFLNARVQGLYRTASALSGKEATAKATILKGMALTAASMALYAASSGDERWKEEPLERRLNYYILYLGDKKILIPKPFEIGAIFSTIPEFFTDLVMGNIRSKDAGRAALMTLTNTFAFNPVPQSVLPIIEVATNYDAFTGRPIETAGVQRLPSGDRAYSTTSQTAIQFGRLTGLSPLKFEQLINGYLGSMGSLGLAAVDSVLSLTGAIPAKPAGIFENEFGDAASFLSGLSRFVKESPDPANRFVGEFYQLKREVDEIYAAVQDRRKNGEIEAALDLMKENRKKLAMRTSLNRMQTTFTDLNREIRRVKRSDDLTPDQKKKRLNRLINQRNRIAGQTEKILERID